MIHEKAVVDYLRGWSRKTEIPVDRFIRWIEIGKSKFYSWAERYGKANEHNGQITRDYWLENWEREAIIRFAIDNPQFIARDFKEFIRISGMSHVKTSPYYPQSNGKVERFHKTIKGECIRVKTPLSLEDARQLAANYIGHYNNVRLHSATSYVAPADKLMGRDEEIFKQREQTPMV